MRTVLTLTFLLIANLSIAQKVYFFGDVLAKQKTKKLYYRLDNEKYSPSKSVETNFHSPYAKGFLDSYRFGLELATLRKHKYLYFNSRITEQTDTLLRNQNRINLQELMKLIEAKKPNEEEININNDLFMNEKFTDLIANQKEANTDQEKFTGKYRYRSSHTKTMNTFELQPSSIYSAKEEDPVNSSFFLNESTGLWKVGTWDYNPKQKAINVYRIYRYNSLVGNKQKPADVGSSFDLFINNDGSLRIFNPAPAVSEVEKF